MKPRNAHELGKFIVTSGEQKVWADDLEAAFKLMNKGVPMAIWIVRNVREMPRMMSIGNGARIAVAPTDRSNIQEVGG